VLGQIYGQLHHKEHALFTSFRQLVNDGYVNPIDSPFAFVFSCTRC
jgi:hypothetical protein